MILDFEMARFGARDYDPSVGKWNSKDTLLFSGGTSNLLEYCKNDPVNCVDPNGKNPVLIAVGIGAFVGATANVSGNYLAGTLTLENAARTAAIGAAGGAAAVLAAGTSALVTATSLPALFAAEVGSGFISTLTAAGIDVGLTLS